MGFKSLLEAQVQGVMDILGQDDGLAPNCTYIETGARVYDTDTRTYTTSDTSYPDVPMVLASFTVEEMDDDVITATDQKAIIATLDLSVVPKSQDKIIDDKGNTYNVEKLKGVPGESLYILHVRKV